MKRINRSRDAEKGMVSILVTMIMLAVITLIVVSFAEVSRRNQREALDSQLSTQAYYAAESGLNIAMQYLAKPANIGADINTTGSCTQFMKQDGVSGLLDAASNTQYACLIVNTRPSTLSLSPLTRDSNQIMYLANTDGAPFTQLKFSWSAQSNSTSSPSDCKASGANGVTLPASDSWNCPYGILRMDLTDASNISNASLESGQGTASFYLIPSYNSGSAFTKAISVNWPPKVQPSDPSAAPSPSCSADDNDCPVRIIPVSCSSSGCSLQMNITGGSTKYAARLTMLYQDTSSLTIASGDATHPINPLTGVGVGFVGGQALIDSTGQSEDELRRVQVRIPLTGSSGVLPSYGLQTTQSICKQIEAGSDLYNDNCSDSP